MLKTKPLLDVEKNLWPDELRWYFELRCLKTAKLGTDFINGINKRFGLKAVPESLDSKAIRLEQCPQEIQELYLCRFDSLTEFLQQNGNSLMFYGGTLCKTLKALKHSTHYESRFNIEDLGESFENCKIDVICRMYQNRCYLTYDCDEKNCIYAKYLPSIACEQSLFITCDTMDELAGWICDRMLKAAEQTRKLAAELHKKMKIKMLEEERRNAQQ